MCKIPFHLHHPFADDDKHANLSQSWVDAWLLEFHKLGFDPLIFLDVRIGLINRVFMVELLIFKSRSLNEYE